MNPFKLLSFRDASPSYRYIFWYLLLSNLNFVNILNLNEFTVANHHNIFDIVITMSYTNILIVYISNLKLVS